jgi:hypothetical protein
MNGYEEFCEYAEKIDLLDSVLKGKGGPFLTVIPRILGKGKTRAEGFEGDRPPAPIERLYEYAKLDLIRLNHETNKHFPDQLRNEQSLAKQRIEELERGLRTPDVWQRFAREILSSLGDPTPGRSGKFMKGDLELIFDAKNLTWSWSLAGAYPLVSKLPHDKDYLIEGLHAAEKRLLESVIEPEDFLRRLTLAWKLARHFSATDQVLIRDVARLYLVAAQADGFWARPCKQTFNDQSEASFVLNLTKSIEVVRSHFELEKATIHQTKLGGKGKDVSFDLPKRSGLGTEPYSYMRPRTPL